MIKMLTNLSHKLKLLLPVIIVALSLTLPSGALSSEYSDCIDTCFNDPANHQRGNVTTYCPSQCEKFRTTDGTKSSADALGSISNPISKLSGGAYGDVTSLPLFISNIVRLITIGAGLFALFNFIGAGINYIAAGGDEQKIQKSWNMITYSMYGLVIIVAAFILTGIISFVLFRDVNTILRPTIYGPGSI